MQLDIQYKYSYLKVSEKMNFATFLMEPTALVIVSVRHISKLGAIYDSSTRGRGCQAHVDACGLGEGSVSSIWTSKQKYLN